MRWTTLGRLLAPAMFALALPRTAGADSGLEPTWRRLVDASKLDEALTLARSAARDPKLSAADRLLTRLLEAETLAEQGEIRAAERAYESVARDAKTKLGAKHELRGRALLGLASLQLQRDDADRAAPVVQEARAILGAAPSSQHAIEAGLLEGAVLVQTDRHSDARALTEELLSLTHGKADLEFERARLSALHCTILHQALDPQRARAAYDETVGALASRELSAAERVVVQITLARMSSWFGDVRGLDWTREAVDWLRTGRGPRHPLLARAQNERGKLALDMGLRTEGLEALEESLDIVRASHGDAYERAVAHLNVAAASAAAGHFSEAERLFEEALTLAEKARHGERLTAVIWSSQAKLAKDRAYPQAAGRLLDKAERALEKMGARGREDLLVTLSIRGTLAQQSGDLETATQAFERQLSLASEIYGPRSLQVAAALSNVALVTMSSAQMGSMVFRPEELLRRSLEIAEAQLGQDHGELIPALVNLSVHLGARNNFAEASQLMKRATTIDLRRLAEIVPRTTPQDVRSHLDRQAATWGVSGSFATSPMLKTFPEGAAEAQRNALGTAFSYLGLDLDVEVMRIRALRKGAGAGPLGETAARRSDLSRGLLQGASDAELKTMTRRLYDAEFELGKLAGKGAVPTLAWVDPQQVARKLPPRSALVQFLMFKPGDSAAQGTSLTTGSHQMGVFVLRPDGSITALSLGEATSLGQHVNQLRQALQARSPSGPLLREAYDLIITPWIDKVSGDDRLLIVPDGYLSLLPFEALKAPDGKYLNERFQISYLVSARELLRLPEPTPASDLGTVTLFGDPDYGSPQNEAGLRPSLAARMSWPRLPGTATEVAALARLAPGARVRTGSEADERSLRALASPRILHLATHGFFLDPQGQPVEGTRGLVLKPQTNSIHAKPSAADADDPLSSLLSEALLDQPMMRSGLVLATANSTPAQGDDGYLTAAELSLVDLSATELAVLSACETGLGELSAGAGVQGLRRALGLAGVRTQVMSLWTVDDDATAALMGEFYRNLRAGQGRAQALQNAKLGLAKKPGWEDPFFWAAFQLSGEWRPLVFSAKPDKISADRQVAQLRTRPSAGCGHCSVGARHEGMGFWLLLAPLLLLAFRRRARRIGVSLAALGLSQLVASSAHAQQGQPSALELNQRGSAKSWQGQYAQAAELYLRAVKLEPDNDYYLVNLASALWHRGDLVRSRERFLQAIEAALAVGARQRAQTYSTSLLRMLMDDIPARYRELALRVNALPVQSEAVIATQRVDVLIQEATAYHTSGDAVRARMKAEEAVKLCESALPKDRYRLAGARQTLALTLASYRDPNAAAMFTEALKVRAKFLGADHPDLSADRLQLANVLGGLGRNEDAIAELEAAVAALTKELGADHARTLVARSNLAQAHASAGRHEQASKLARETLASTREALGPHSLFSLQLERVLAESLHASGKNAQARSAAEAASLHHLRVLGPQNPTFSKMIVLLRDLSPKEAIATKLAKAETEARLIARYTGQRSIAAINAQVTVAGFEIEARILDAAMARLNRAYQDVVAGYGASSVTAIDLGLVIGVTANRAGRIADVESVVIATGQQAEAILGPRNETAISAVFNEGFLKASLKRPGGLERMATAVKWSEAYRSAEHPSTKAMQETLNGMKR